MNPLLLDKLNTHPELLSDEASQQYTITDVSWETLDDCLGFILKKLAPVFIV